VRKYLTAGKTARLEKPKEFIMAMKDVKSFTVVPADEDKTVQLWMSFGWELKSTQEVKTQDVQKFTGQDSDGTEHYQTTKGEHYIKLTFERDPERKNYAELKALEAQYYAPLPDLHATSPGIKPEKPGIIGLIMTIIGFLVGASFIFIGIVVMIEGVTETTGIICIIIGVIPSLLGIRGIMRRKSFSSRLKYWETSNEAYQSKHSAEEKVLSEAKKKRTDALEKARSLM
jgi:hypothetical protein